MTSLKDVVGDYVDSLINLEEGLIDVGERELAKQVNKLVGDLIRAIVEKAMGV